MAFALVLEQVVWASVFTVACSNCALVGNPLDQCVLVPYVSCTISLPVFTSELLIALFALERIGSRRRRRRRSRRIGWWQAAG
jgi:hypothetical protein